MEESIIIWEFRNGNSHHLSQIQWRNLHKKQYLEMNLEARRIYKDFCWNRQIWADHIQGAQHGKYFHTFSNMLAYHTTPNTQKLAPVMKKKQCIVIVNCLPSDFWLAMSLHEFKSEKRALLLILIQQVLGLYVRESES